uniref:IMP2-like protein n=1 Tax=Mandrillus leucophaeus TaxID=9568 RepID=A0A2K5XD16_MANLE
MVTESTQNYASWCSGETFRLAGYTIQYGCIAHCAFEYVGGGVMCSGPSVEPTIQNSDIVFEENLISIEVTAKSPSDPKSNICKRVTGLEGDKILTSSPSDFLKSHSYAPVGHVWSEGDNLQNSTDSSDFGFLCASLNGHRFSDD